GLLQAVGAAAPGRAGAVAVRRGGAGRHSTRRVGGAGAFGRSGTGPASGGTTARPDGRTPRWVPEPAAPARGEAIPCRRGGLRGRSAPCWRGGLLAPLPRSRSRY